MPCKRTDFSFFYLKMSLKPVIRHFFTPADRFFLLIFSVSMTFSACSGPTVIAENAEGYETVFDWRERLLKPNVLKVNPKLKLLIYGDPSRDSERLKPAVIIFPGGGYKHLAVEKEGRQAALWFQQRGFIAVVCLYPLPDGDYGRSTIAACKRAVTYLYKHAEQYHINRQQIGACGFSAGGHLCSVLNSQWSETIPIQFNILFYPVLSFEEGLAHQGSKHSWQGESEDTAFSAEKCIHADYPPTFLVHAAADPVVVAENSRRYAQGLSDYNVSNQLCILYGIDKTIAHGFGLGHRNINLQWENQLTNWLNTTLN